MLHLADVEPDGQCAKCGSDDHWLATETCKIQGVSITVKREYCNPCGDTHTRVFIEGKVVAIIN
jgi:hypothetical protein